MPCFSAPRKPLQMTHLPPWQGEGTVGQLGSAFVPPSTSSLVTYTHCLALLTTFWDIVSGFGLNPRLPGLCPALGGLLFLFSCHALLEAGATLTGPRQALRFGQLLMGVLAFATCEL